MKRGRPEKETKAEDLIEGGIEEPDEKVRRIIKAAKKRRNLSQAYRSRP